MMRILGGLLATTLLLSCGPALAHGEDDGLLFVAPDGTDKGDCDERDHPCRSLHYAMQMAGKGAEMRVAGGTYPVDTADDLFYLVSGVINAHGGYSRADEFHSTGGDASILSGVPFAYRELLAERGFQIIADRKRMPAPQFQATGKMMQLQEQLKSSLPASACIGGLANGLPCDAVDLMSHLARDDISASPGAANDVWGFVDLNSGREYALIGFNVGTAVIDVTNPELPREVGFIPGQNTSWRDVKVYQFFDAARDRWRAYAYVTTDGGTEGMFVIDLAELPHSIRRVAYVPDIQRAHNVYVTNTDFSTGIALTDRAPLLIVGGSEIDSGKFRAYSLADPAAPAYIGGPATPDYMHDAASIIISDTRTVSQCQVSGPHCDIVLDFNESTFEIWNVTDPAAVSRLSSNSYNFAGYIHSGWWSEDKQFVFVQDELDESQRSLPTTLRIFSIADLRNPVHVGTWTGPTGAIDHNGFVRGNRYYMSNYTRGLTVLDITTPATPVQLGFFDTSPSPEQTVFAGAWGAYPFFHSGNIAVSDMQSGLYIVGDRTRDVVQGSLQFSSHSVAATEGQQAQLRIQRVGGSVGAVSVDYQVLSATADAGDYQASTGVLSWSDGDAADRILSIGTVNDGIAENLEQLLVRLINPTGGATLGDDNTASVYIGDPGALPAVRLANDVINVSERGFATAVVVLQRQNSAAGAASVDYSISGGDASAGADFSGNTAGTVSWAAGDGNPKTLEFPIVADSASESTEFFALTLSNAVGVTINGATTVRISIEESGTGTPPAAPTGGGATGPGTLLWLAVLGLLGRRGVNRRGQYPRAAVRSASRKGGA